MRVGVCVGVVCDGAYYKAQSAGLTIITYTSDFCCVRWSLLQTLVHGQNIMSPCMHQDGSIIEYNIIRKRV